jgi:hypothetical protein
MLSFHHEILVELFRGNSELAVALLRTCAGIAVDHTRVELGSIDLSQVASTEYRADAVVILYDLADRPVAGVIVEVQRQIERDKLLTWPAYVAALRAKLACPAVLLVIAPDPAVAAWARRPIELGHPGFLLTPVVIPPPGLVCSERGDPSAAHLNRLQVERPDSDRTVGDHVTTASRQGAPSAVPGDTDRAESAAGAGRWPHRPRRGPVRRPARCAASRAARP